LAVEPISDKYCVKHLPLNRVIREVELNNDRRLTIAEKLDLMRCIQILKRCARLKSQMRQDIIDYLTPLPSSYDMSVHEQWQTVMRVMSQGLYDREGIVDRMLNERHKRTLLSLHVF